jgi:plasmid stabilization system protein ParE
MSFVLEFLPEASAEIESVTGDYQARSPGLGTRFRAEVESACAAIVQHPLLWRLRPGQSARIPVLRRLYGRRGPSTHHSRSSFERHPDYFKTRVS